MRRVLLAIAVTFPAAAAPLPAETPRVTARLEGIFGQPSTLYGVRGGGGAGLGFRLTDQLWIVSDVESRAAPGGGITSLAFGLQATLDATPVSPYLELAVVDLSNRKALGYSLATRTGFGADWQFSRAAAVGIVVRTYAAFDPEDGNSTLSGLEAVLRLVFTPGAK
ncbi:MAG TPA: hypothetical protein VLW85_14470 [Myxococcales bacterium]|nr:hypothetical protein [Myxococcales bacterium]